jgi:glycosyltransferase involved in cell wall biosynthesis
MSDTTGVCVLIRSLANGGAEKQSVLLTKALDEKYPTYLVVLDQLPLHPKHLDKIKQENLQVVFLKGNLWQKLNMFAELIRSKNISALFSFLPSDTLLAAVVGRYLGVKHIFGGLRNAYVPWKKRIPLRFLHNYLLDYSISNCHSGVKSLVQQGFRSEKFIVIHNALEHQLKPLPDVKINAYVDLITVGRFVDQKNYPLALRIFKKLLETSPSAHLLRYTIIGYGPREQQIRDLIVDLGLEDRVRLMINPKNVGQLLASADIYLSTSLFEGLSNAIMEGMEYGLPVVATRVGDNDYLVNKGKNGYLHDVKDEEGMLNSLHKLVRDRDKRIRMGKCSQDIISSNFSFPAFQKKYFELIEQKMTLSHETA